MRRATTIAVLALMGFALAACGGGGASNGGRLSGSSPDGEYKVGRPYTVAGHRFVPREDWNYNEVGIASWYGPNFHGRPTANGERFDQNLFTAAHTTLQLPVHARVTNLENGRSVIVRINDRGPFVDDRIIDLSRAAAEELDMIRNGTARVRVEVLDRAPLNVQSADARRVMEGDVNPRRYASNNNNDRRRNRNRDRDDRGEDRPQNGGTVTVPPGPVVTASVAAATEIIPETPVAIEGPLPQPATRPAPERSVASYEPYEPDPAQPYVSEPQVLGQPAATTVAATPHMYVQTGAYLLEANAYDVADALDADLGQQVASVDPAWIDGRLFYRVRVGPFLDAREAGEVLRQVTGRGHQGARIVVD